MEKIQCPEFRRAFFEIEKSELSRNKFEEKGWVSVVVVGMPDLLHQEWLEEAAKAMGSKEFVYYIFSGASNENCKIIETEVSKGELSVVLFENLGDIFVTDKKNRFVMYQEVAGDYFILAGPIEFIKQAYRASFKTAKLDYHGWIDGQVLGSPQGKRIMEKIWEKYAIQY